MFQFVGTKTGGSAREGIADRCYCGRGGFRLVLNIGESESENEKGANTV